LFQPVVNLIASLIHQPNSTDIILYLSLRTNARLMTKLDDKLSIVQNVKLYWHAFLYTKASFCIKGKIRQASALLHYIKNICNTTRLRDIMDVAFCMN